VIQTRRAPGEARSLLLKAGRELFASKGYAGASTRDIARRAEVSEALLFRHFGSKAGLFEESIIEPFRGFVAEFADEWRNLPPVSLPAEVLAERFVGRFYDLLHAHRELVIALVAADAFEDEVSSLGSDFAHTFDALETLTGVEAEGRGFAGLDTPLTVRVTAGMVMSAALLSGWLFGARRPSRDRLVHEMTMYVLYGISKRPPDGPQLEAPSAANRRPSQTGRPSKIR
jgi:AcrR family transcriptional regulator